MRRTGYPDSVSNEAESDIRGEIRFLTDDTQQIRETIKHAMRDCPDHILTFSSDYRNNTPVITRFNLYGFNGAVEYLVDLLHRKHIPVEYVSRRGPVTWGFLNEDLEYQRLAWNFVVPGSPMDFDEQVARRKQQQLLKLITE